MKTVNVNVSAIDDTPVAATQEDGLAGTGHVTDAVERRAAPASQVGLIAAMTEQSGAASGQAAPAPSSPIAPATSMGLMASESVQQTVLDTTPPGGPTAMSVMGSELTVSFDAASVQVGDRILVINGDDRLVHLVQQSDIDAGAAVITLASPAELDLAATIVDPAGNHWPAYHLPLTVVEGFDHAPAAGVARLETAFGTITCEKGVMNVGSYPAEAGATGPLSGQLIVGEANNDYNRDVIRFDLKGPASRVTLNLGGDNWGNNYLHFYDKDGKTLGFIDIQPGNAAYHDYVFTAKLGQAIAYFKYYSSGERGGVAFESISVDFLDMTPPTTIATVTSMDQDSGVDSGDWLTNDGSAGRLMQGSLSVPLAAHETVQVSTDGGLTWVNALVDGLAWSAQDLISHEQNWTIQVRVTDSSGLVGNASVQEVTLDTVAPNAPTSVSATDQDITVSFDKADVTAGDWITVINGDERVSHQVLQSDVDSGQAIISLGSAPQADLTAVIVDKAGNASLETYLPETVMEEFNHTPALAIARLDTAFGSITCEQGVMSVGGHAGWGTGGLTTGKFSIGHSTTPSNYDVIRFDLKGPATKVLLNLGVDNGGNNYVEFYGKDGQSLGVMQIAPGNETFKRFEFSAGTGEPIAYFKYFSKGEQFGVAIESIAVEFSLPPDTIPPVAIATVTSMGNDSGFDSSDWLTNDGSAGRLMQGALSAVLAAHETVQVSTDGGLTWVNALVEGLAWSAQDNNSHAESWQIQVRVVDSSGLVGQESVQNITLDTLAPNSPIALIATDNKITVIFDNTNVKVGDWITVINGDQQVSRQVQQADINAGKAIVTLAAAPVGDVTAVIADQAGNSLPAGPLPITYVEEFNHSPALGIAWLETSFGSITREAGVMSVGGHAGAGVGGIMTGTFSVGRATNPDNHDVIRFDLKNPASKVVITLGGDDGGNNYIEFYDKHGNVIGRHEVSEGAEFSKVYAFSAAAGEQIAYFKYFSNGEQFGVKFESIAVNFVDPVEDSGPTAVATVTAMDKDTGFDSGDWLTHDGSAGRWMQGSLSAALAAHETVQVSTDGGVTWVDALVDGLAWTAQDSNSHAESWKIQVRVVDESGRVGGTSTQDIVLDTVAPDAPTSMIANGKSITVGFDVTNAKVGDWITVMNGDEHVSRELTQVDIDSASVVLRLATAPVADMTAVIVDKAGNSSAEAHPTWLEEFNRAPAIGIATLETAFGRIVCEQGVMSVSAHAGGGTGGLMSGKFSVGHSTTAYNYDIVRFDLKGPASKVVIIMGGDDGGNNYIEFYNQAGQAIGRYDITREALFSKEYTFEAGAGEEIAYFKYVSNGEQFGVGFESIAVDFVLPGESRSQALGEDVYDQDTLAALEGGSEIGTLPLDVSEQGLDLTSLASAASPVDGGELSDTRDVTLSLADVLENGTEQFFSEDGDVATVMQDDAGDRIDLGDLLGEEGIDTGAWTHDTATTQDGVVYNTTSPSGVAAEVLTQEGVQAHLV